MRYEMLWLPHLHSNGGKLHDYLLHNQLQVLGHAPCSPILFLTFCHGLYSNTYLEGTLT